MPSNEYVGDVLYKNLSSGEIFLYYGLTDKISSETAVKARFEEPTVILSKPGIQIVTGINCASLGKTAHCTDTLLLITVISQGCSACRKIQHNWKLRRFYESILCMTCRIFGVFHDRSIEA